MISPSSRLIDPLVKRAKYEQAGVPSYWIADPGPRQLTVLELVDGSYHERAVLEAAALDVPLQRSYPMRITLWL